MGKDASGNGTGLAGFLERDGLLRAVLEQAPAAVVVTDRDGSILYANPAFTEETGYALAEVLGKNPRILKSGLHSPAFYAHLWSTITAGRVFKALFFNRRKDGRVYPTFRVIFPLKVGARTYFVAYGRDIAHKKSLIRVFLEDFPHPVVGFDSLGRLFYFNRAAAQAFRLEPDQIGTTWLARESVLARAIREALEGAPTTGRLLEPVFWHEGRAYSFYFGRVQHRAGDLLYFLGTFYDVTDLYRALEFERGLARFLRRAVRNEPVGGLYQEALAFALAHVPGAESARLMVVRGEAARFLAVHGHPAALVGRTLPLSAVGGRAFLRPGRWSLDARLRARWTESCLHADTRGVPAEVLVAPASVHRDGVLYLVLEARKAGALSDGDLPKVQVLASTLALLQGWSMERERAVHLAFHDPLTGLPNRRLLFEIGPRLLARARRGAGTALFMIDLDKLKRVNDVYGHEAGDRYLRVAAERMKGALFEGDYLFRVGGDEFVALLPGAGENGAKKAARRLASALARPFELAGYEVGAAASVGIALAPRDATDLDELLAKADFALYRAKKTGSAFVFYDAELEKAWRDEQMLEARLRRALREGLLAVHAQPILDLARRTYAAYELLLRWEVPPARFIPLAEQLGLGSALDHYVIERAEAIARRLGRKVWVNLLPSTLAGGLKRHPDPRWVGFEVTEYGLLNPSAKERAWELHRRGYTLVLDDFGEGYSNLNTLVELPVSYVKLSQHLVRAALRAEDPDPKARALLEATLYGFGKLEVEAVAEGIEEERMIAEVARLGVRYVQGYAIARPDDPDRFAG